MTGSDYTKAFIAGNTAAFTSLLEEMDREGYETLAQIRGSIHQFLDINKRLEENENEC